MLLEQYLLAVYQQFSTRKTLSFFNTFQRNPFEDQHEFLAGYLHWTGGGIHLRHLKSALLKSFVPDGKACLVPYQQFDQSACTVDENEDVAR